MLRAPFDKYLTFLKEQAKQKEPTPEVYALMQLVVDPLISANSRLIDIYTDKDKAEELARINNEELPAYIDNVFYHVDTYTLK